MLANITVRSIFSSAFLRVLSVFSTVLPPNMPSEENIPGEVFGDHTETLQIEYDPKQTHYSDLLKLFWNNHDCTASNKPQYMSAIFYHDDEQKHLAEETKNEHQGKVSSPIATKVLPAKTFYDAEGYHQKYLLRRHWRIFQSLNLSEAQVISSHVAARLNGYLNGHGTAENLREESSKWNLNEQQKELVFNTANAAQCNSPACGR